MLAFLKWQQKERKKAADTNLNTFTITFLNLINFLHLRDAQLNFSALKCSTDWDVLQLKGSFMDRLIRTCHVEESTNHSTATKYCKFTRHDSHCVHCVGGQAEMIVMYVKI